MPHHQNRIFHGQTACPASDSGAREPDRRRGAPQLRIRHVHGRKRAVSFLNRFRTTTRHFCGVSTPALRLYSASLSWAVKLDSSLLCFAEHSNLFWPDLRLPHASCRSLRATCLTVRLLSRFYKATLFPNHPLEFSLVFAVMSWGLPLAVVALIIVSPPTTPSMSSWLTEALTSSTNR